MYHSRANHVQHTKQINYFKDNQNTGINYLSTDEILQQKFITDMIQRSRLYYKYKQHLLVYDILKHMLPKNCRKRKLRAQKCAYYKTELNTLECRVWKQYFGMDISKYGFLTIPDSFNQRTQWLDDHVPPIVLDKHTEYGVKVLSTYLM